MDWDRQGIWHHHTFYPLPARTWRILAHLLDHANQVVTQEALFRAGWGDIRNLWDLQVHIHRIREAIEPHPHHPRWLVTRRGGGYLIQVEQPSQHA